MRRTEAMIGRQTAPVRSLNIQAEYGTFRDRRIIFLWVLRFGRSRKVNAMKKTLMALAAVATLAVATASPAQAWRGWWGPGLAAGVIGGAIVGGAIANSPYYGPGYYGAGYPGYYGAPYSGPYGPCYWQTQRFWDGYGWQMRNVRVCG
jgi:hypothetical protein